MKVKLDSSIKQFDQNPREYVLCLRTDTSGSLKLYAERRGTGTWFKSTMGLHKQNYNLEYIWDNIKPVPEPAENRYNPLHLRIFKQVHDMLEAEPTYSTALPSILPPRAPPVQVHPNSYEVIHYLENLNIRAEISPEGKITIYSNEAIPSQSHKNLMDTFTYRGINYTTSSENNTITIDNSSIPTFLTYLKKEKSHLDNIQTKFDELYRDEQDGSWGIKIVPDSIGFYHIEIPPGANQNKKYFSVFNLLKTTRIHSYRDRGGYPIFDSDYVNNFNKEYEYKGTEKRGHGQLLGVEALERIDHLFVAADLAKQELAKAMERVDPTQAKDASLGIGRKPLNDLYQNLVETEPRDTFIQKTEMSPEMAHLLHSEDGEAILPPDSMSLSTKSDTIQNFLEHCYAVGKLKAKNGEDKTFLKDTRESGLLHRSNIGLDQWPTISDLAEQFCYLIETSVPRKSFDQALSNPDSFNAMYMDHQARLADFLEHDIGSNFIKPLDPTFMDSLQKLRENAEFDLSTINELQSNVIVTLLNNYATNSSNALTQFRNMIKSSYSFSYYSSLDEIRKNKQSAENFLFQLRLDRIDISKYRLSNGQWNYQKIEFDLPQIILRYLLRANLVALNQRSNTAGASNITIRFADQAPSPVVRYYQSAVSYRSSG